jgi:hypothetical protein
VPASLNPRRHKELLALLGFCALALGACFEKIVDVGCPNDETRINDQCYATLPDGFIPITCQQSSQCVLPWEPICDTSTQMCRQCQPSGGVSSECMAKDASRRLCTTAGSCAQCLTNLDCLADQKTCDTAAGSCVGCMQNGDCASGICGAGGVCADPKMIIYVNNDGPSCAVGSGQGTLEDPYCTVQRGLDQGASQGKRVVIFAGAHAYTENVSIKPTAAYTVNAIGIGQPVLAPSAAGPAILLSTLGQAINLSLDGLTIQNAAGESGIRCDGTSTSLSLTHVTVLRSTLRNNAKYGLAATNCQANLDQVRVELNQTGGLLLSDSDVVATNLLVVQNGVGAGTTYGGINILNPNGGTVAIVNSTVVKNVESAGASLASGIACSAVTSVLNCVVQGNTGAATEINATLCKPDHSAFVGAAAPNTGNMNVELVACTDNLIFQNPGAGNYVPISGGSCTLVDKGASAATFGTTTVTAPNHDFDGRSRPQPSNGMFDIGAYEL